MKDKRNFLIFSILILNLFYVLLLLNGSISRRDDLLIFFILLTASYLSHSFGVIRFGKFAVSLSFFFLFPMLVIFGPVVTSIVAYLIVLFQYAKIDIPRRIYGGVQYALSYATAGFALNYAGVSVWGIILAFFVFKIMNFILVDLFLYYYYGRYKDFITSLKYLSLESGVFALALPMAYFLYFSNGYITYFILYTLIFPILLTYLLSVESNARMELERERDALSKNVNQLKRVLEVSEMLKSNVPLVDLMMKVASIIQKDLGWEYALVSLVKPDGSIDRIAYAGISNEDFQRLRQNPPTLAFVKSLMRDEYKISNSYFIPEEANVNLPDEMVYVGNYDVKDADSWKDRDLLWVPIYDKSGRMIAYISPDKPASGKRPKIEDITILEIFANQVLIALENSSEFETLQEKAIRDQQTGLYNHTEFYNRLDKFVKENERFALLMMDIDDFKLVNDSYGHQMGDLIIEYLADKIKNSIRHGDIAARYGGDEFSVILKDIDKSTARSIAERLRISVAQGNPPVKITISIGIASYPVDSSSSNGIVASADRALYLAKMRGKNQVSFSN
ncbi:sensor domain-containing diguanylate cyclase [Athalassotoga saccharophila]|uniref:sensor domain-containing diguanylate cyclase n=1 Tax=Athalassotoga saccharophila TaxID=1441386 RepID=UPI00137B6DD2|nr:GGDEF domain-containing protein [Athalassotoga saccharophila]BBJ28859.1 diguanylate cyclase [Athalassotoga saccharophila]